ncbi:heme-binding protein 2 [Diretmus argenteus]
MLRTIGKALFSGLEQLKFTPHDNQGADYEVRTYQATRLVSTSVNGTQWDAAMSTGFRRLFAYIQGNNQTKTKVEMTVPVICKVVPGAGHACESTYTISFYIPEEHQAGPPQPSDTDVFLQDMTEFTVYVRTFGGFAKEQMMRDELSKLLGSLQRDGVPFKDEPFYTAGYDSPFKLTSRRNEVWILKKTEQE